MKIISWNLLHRAGASLDEVTALVLRERPDLLLMQEATAAIDVLAERLGGHYARVSLPGRAHGLAAWSAAPFTTRTIVLPSGAVVRRVAQVVCGRLTVANVHLSHGQWLNRRQLRRIAEALPPQTAVLGDCNMVGAALLTGFRDVGPRVPTHASAGMVPLRLDRCLVRGLHCRAASVLPRGASDHRPIAVVLEAVPSPPRSSS